MDITIAEGGPVLISTQTPATATAVLHTALSDMWPQVAFTVTATDTALTISWSDGPTKPAVSSLLRRFLPAGHHLWDQAVLLASPDGHLGVCHLDISDIALHRTIVTGTDTTQAAPTDVEYGAVEAGDYSHVVEVVKAVDSWVLHQPSFSCWATLLSALHQPWLTAVLASCVDEIGADGVRLLRRLEVKALSQSDRLAANTVQRLLTLHRRVDHGAQASWSLMSELACWTFNDWADAGKQLRLFAGVSSHD